MTCAFDLAHYRELLDAAKAGGYRFAGFDRAPEPGDLILRHDVDLSLDAAIAVAEVEAEAGAWSTWFLMTRSVFYNLGSHEGERAIARLRELGGRIAHHAVWPDVDLDDRFEATVAWHNPDPEYMTAPIDGATNVMTAPWFDPEHYRSDSNAHWRHGCPHEQLARGEFEWLQLLTHPEIWAFEGATMGETMQSFLDADRAGRLEHLRADRIDLGVRPLTVIVTASGSPGTAALLRALRENGEREVRLVGTDMSERSVGRHLCDAFHLVPAGSDPGFAGAVRELAEREGADAVLPQSSSDLEALAAALSEFDGVAAVLVSPLDANLRSNDKAETYAFLHRLGLPAPEFRRVSGAAEVEAAARELGYPKRAVCFKPVISSGSRGFRILDATVDRADQLLRERPGSVSMQLEEAVEILASVDDRTELLVMELAKGPERTIDGIANGREIVLGHAKTREEMRAGLAMYFETLDDPALMELGNAIVAELGIEHFFNIQLVGEHVIEINPRISTVVYQEDLNLPYLGIKRALGEVSEDELRALHGRIRPGRTALRYFDQLEWDA